MADLVVIVPSRGRPEAAMDLAETFRETCEHDVRPVFAVDADDPTVEGYYEVVRQGLGSMIESANTSMVDALNKRATGFAGLEDGLRPYALGFMGDDHRPRTKGWDTVYLDALREMGTGIVYGNDLLQGERIPTQVAMTSDIVRALGYMAPPTLTHLFVDNFWLDLGKAAGCIRYLPDVVVEHMHPVAGKADWDEGHVRVNAPEMYQRDANAYARYRYIDLPAAVEKVRQLRAAHV